MVSKHFKSKYEEVHQMHKTHQFIRNIHGSKLKSTLNRYVVPSKLVHSIIIHFLANFRKLPTDNLSNPITTVIRMCLENVKNMTNCYRELYRLMYETDIGIDCFVSALFFC